MLIIYSVILATATFIEVGSGTDAALAIYQSSYSIGLYILMLINFVAITIRSQLVERGRFGTLLLHGGFIVILGGALITHIWGYEGYIHIREGAKSSTISMKSGEIRQIPLSIELKDFVLKRYEGSGTPSSFESFITVEYQGEKSDYHVYMNNIGRVGGFRLYQTSYDQDEMGTLLTVNSDYWGSMVTYLGYFLLCLGLIVAPLQKGSRVRNLYSKLGGSAMALLFMFSVDGAYAQTNVIDKDVFQKFGELLVKSDDGRIKPVDTYSSELLRKIYGRAKFDKLDSNQVLLGIISNPAKWQLVPIIHTTKELAKAEFGVDGEHISLYDLFDDNGKYIFEARMGEISRKRLDEQSKMDKELIKLDERANILFALMNGLMLPLYPTTESHWFSSGEDLEGKVFDQERMMVESTIPWLANAVAMGDNDDARRVLDLINTYQTAKLRDSNLDRSRIKAELFYNRADIFRWAFRHYLIIGFILLVSLLVSDKFTQISRILVWAVIAIFVAHTAGLALRWYISGHAPWSNGYETMVYVAWSTLLCGVCFVRKEPIILALSAILTGVILFVSNLSWLDPHITPLVPVLKSYWLMIHVSVITASYGFFGISAMCGMTTLINIILRRDSRKLEIINELSINIGEVLLTIGIFFGAIWANESWGRYWGWDPKETWALITMVIYAIVLHIYHTPKLSSRLIFGALSLVSFASVLMTFFGVNFYLSGMHSYGSNSEVSMTAVISVTLVVAALIGVAAIRNRK